MRHGGEARGSGKRTGVWVEGREKGSGTRGRTGHHTFFVVFLSSGRSEPFFDNSSFRVRIDETRIASWENKIEPNIDEKRP